MDVLSAFEGGRASFGLTELAPAMPGCPSPRPTAIVATCWTPMCCGRDRTGSCAWAAGCGRSPRTPPARGARERPPRTWPSCSGRPAGRRSWPSATPGTRCSSTSSRPGAGRLAQPAGYPDAPARLRHRQGHARLRGTLDPVGLYLTGTLAAPTRATQVDSRRPRRPAGRRPAGRVRPQRGGGAGRDRRPRRPGRRRHRLRGGGGGSGRGRTGRPAAPGAPPGAAAPRGRGHGGGRGPLAARTRAVVAAFEAQPEV